MLRYEHHPRFERAHCLVVTRSPPNRIFVMPGGEWYSLHSEVFEWLVTHIGLIREEWEYSHQTLWFRTREQAMRFKLTWS